MARIVIVGGGFAGLFTALTLEQYSFGGERPEILLIDRSEHFVFAPLLYELVSGELKSWEVAPRFDELLENTGIRFLQQEVVGFDLAGGKVKLAGGTAEAYDRLVIAAGGQTPVEIVPGAKEHALPFRTLADAQALIARLKAALEAGADPLRVALVGAGASGVELACKLADTLQTKGTIVLFDREKEILGEFSAAERKLVRAELEERSVRLRLGTKILRVGADGLEIDAGSGSEWIPAEVVLWTVGTGVPSLIGELEVAKGAGGRVAIQPTLQLVDYPEVFALGDLAFAADDSGKFLGASAQLAFQQAGFCAWNLWASLNNRPLLAFRYAPLGQLLGLGIDSGVASLLGRPLSGPLAYLVRRLVYLYRMPTAEHRLKVALNWASQPVLRWLSGSGASR
ncbi:NAD(P)/FAD-dependent oxidoreductase [Gloeobacter kilaueensis]|uniref:demethylphylloquinone reductase n=1 Tax=Gloeobacter kilaueensis (strain ATCC BAA-2537 / CCAP 1431/1 / ULC 316 / JS1) TaxID=1183438 RepID=U5QEU1_GLOK1|nr:NAD(P)/FAD-dependent oxidoreductase [Gloeobacter kilaueensis]AGY57431.1 NADH dehydrogenase [Gloeobacter kilaueensis JS1]